jgi:hypothetical protein
VALTRLEVDQAWRGQRPLGGFSADKQLAACDEHERVLMNLVLLQDLALRQQEHNDAVGIIVGAKDLRLVSRDTQTI